MSPAAFPRSHIGGASSDASTITVTNRSTEKESGTRTKRTLRRCTRDDDATNETKSLQATKVIEVDENQNVLDPPLTSKRMASSMSFNTNRLLQTVRQHLGTSNIECPVPHKATSQHATKGLTGSPTSFKSPFRKYRKRQRSASFVELEAGLQTTTATKMSKGLDALDASSRDIPVQFGAFMGYALQDLNVQIRCYEHHITTWDAPDQ